MTKPLPLYWYLLGMLAATGLILIRSLNPILEHDTWWHLATGRWIVAHGTVPSVDPFSQMSRESPTIWRAYSWLFELGLFHVHESGSLRGILYARIALVTLSCVTILLFLTQRNGMTLLSLLAGVLMAVVLMPFARERPWHLTMMFTTITLWTVMIIRDRCTFRYAFALIPLYVLWANLHIQFVLGLCILGLAVLFPGQAGRWKCLALAISCALATLLNPYDIGLYEVVAEYATHSTPMSIIHELAPPEWRQPSTLAVSLLFFAAVVSQFQTRRVDGFKLALLIVAVVLSFRMRRDIWFGALAAIACLPRTSQLPSVRDLIGIGLAIIQLLVIITLAWMPWPEVVEDSQPRQYPSGAIGYLRGSVIPGPLYNDIDWGGYLIWKLPEYPVSIDGRTNLYGDQRLSQSDDSYNVDGAWRNDDVLNKCQAVLAPKGCVLAGSLLNAKSDWGVAYEDDLAILFARVERK
ncbi:hypothetical protein BH11PLA2_BH11PLA2_37570 [soil metagenome]